MSNRTVSHHACQAPCLKAMFQILKILYIQLVLGEPHSGRSERRNRKSSLARMFRHENLHAGSLVLVLLQPAAYRYTYIVLCESKCIVQRAK
jgi:hypothetical protein